jgi:hypothetical protein
VEERVGRNDAVSVGVAGIELVAHPDNTIDAIKTHRYLESLISCIANISLNKRPPFGGLLL